MPAVPWVAAVEGAYAAAPSGVHTSVASSHRPFLPDHLPSQICLVCAVEVVVEAFVREAVACAEEAVVHTSEALGRHTVRFAPGCGLHIDEDPPQGGYWRVTRQPCHQANSNC